MSSTAASSFWRQAGLSYLQYANKAASVLRETLKEPLRSQAAGRSAVSFGAHVWKDGNRGARGEEPLVSIATVSAVLLPTHSEKLPIIHNASVDVESLKEAAKVWGNKA